MFQNNLVSNDKNKLRMNKCCSQMSIGDVEECYDDGDARDARDDDGDGDQ